MLALSTMPDVFHLLRARVADAIRTQAIEDKLSAIVALLAAKFGTSIMGLAGAIFIDASTSLVRRRHAVYIQRLDSAAEAVLVLATYAHAGDTTLHQLRQLTHELVTVKEEMKARGDQFDEAVKRVVRVVT